VFCESPNFHYFAVVIFSLLGPQREEGVESHPSSLATSLVQARWIFGTKSQFDVQQLVLFFPNFPTRGVRLLQYSSSCSHVADGPVRRVLCSLLSVAAILSRVLCYPVSGLILVSILETLGVRQI